MGGSVVIWAQVGLWMRGGGGLHLTVEMDQGEL